MISLYQIKPQFQALLRPLVRRLAARGITANSVTLIAMLVSCLLGLLLFQAGAGNTRLFLLLPAWMLLRMGFNAIDGMLAREFNQKTPLGAYLNELSDVISDAALYLPFAMIAPFGWGSIGSIIFLSALSEMTGIMGPMVGAPRSYLGPMGKSDRALVFGLLGLWLALAGSFPAWAFWLLPAVGILICINIINRIRHGLPKLPETS